MSKFDFDWPHGHTTSDGREVRDLHRLSRPLPSGDEIIGVVDGALRSWRADGRFYNGCPFGVDLVNKHKPKPALVIDRWLNIYRSHVSKHTSRVSANAAAKYRGACLACVHIRWTEGKGAEIVDDGEGA